MTNGIWYMCTLILGRDHEAEDIAACIPSVVTRPKRFDVVRMQTRPIGRVYDTIVDIRGDKRVDSSTS